MIAPSDLPVSNSHDLNHINIYGGDIYLHTQSSHRELLSSKNRYDIAMIDPDETDICVMNDRSRMTMTMNGNVCSIIMQLDNFSVVSGSDVILSWLSVQWWLRFLILSNILASSQPSTHLWTPTITQPRQFDAWFRACVIAVLNDIPLSDIQCEQVASRGINVVFPSMEFIRLLTVLDNSCNIL